MGYHRPLQAYSSHRIWMTAFICTTAFPIYGSFYRYNIPNKQTFSTHFHPTAHLPHHVFTCHCPHLRRGQLPPLIAYHPITPPHRTLVTDNC